MRYKYYQDESGKREWRWRFKAGLNDREIIAVSSEGYVNKGDCLHGIELVKGSADAPVEGV